MIDNSKLQYSTIVHVIIIIIIIIIRSFVLLTSHKLMHHGSKTITWSEAESFIAQFSVYDYVWK